MLDFAWRTFIAVNWPGAFGGRGMQWFPAITIDRHDSTARYPRWASWPSPQTLRESLKTCRLGDAIPTLSPGTNAPSSAWDDNPGFLSNINRNARSTDPGTHRDAPTSHTCVYDQRGNPVDYEIRVSPYGSACNFFQAVCKFSPDDNAACGGVLALDDALLTTNRSSLSFQFGQCGGQGPPDGPDAYNQPGATEIKLAWKVLSPEEIKRHRYLQRTATVADACGDLGNRSEQTLGLVGFHVMQLSDNYGNWTWATFEQVDNLTPDRGAGTASFYDRQCTDCVANTSQRGADGKCKTQITRIHDIPQDVELVNAQFRGFLHGASSVLEHYQLIDVQYDHAETGAGASVRRERPHARELRNSVIEAYEVPGIADKEIPRSCTSLPKFEARTGSCMSCHQQGADFSFVPRVELCNCQDERQWIGKDKCEALGFTCPAR